MISKERVRLALTREGIPDRIFLKFDLCKSSIEYYSKNLRIDPGHCLFYYEDLSYRISANAIRTHLGSDCVVVGGAMACGFEPVAADRVFSAGAASDRAAKMQFGVMPARQRQNRRCIMLVK